MPNEMLQEAIKSIKAGQRHRAKDLLTRLLRADQANIEYWLWMSAAVETEKEQIFCLQNALKIDPNSIAARRGLVVLGALRPEEAGLPPPQTLENFHAEVPKLGSGSMALVPAGGGGGFLSRRRNRERLAIFALGGVGLVIVIFLFSVLVAPNLFRPRRVVVVTSAPPTHTLEPTLKPGVTVTVAPCTLPYDPDPNTPLSSYLCLTQTPTPVPVATEASRNEESYNSMKNGYRDNNWGKILSSAPQTILLLPDNPRVYFYAAEAYRHTGDLSNALKNYRSAIAKDAKFAPAYWGKALAEIDQGNSADALQDFAGAISADANFYPAYLDRALFYSANGNYPRALSDLEQAKLVAPGNGLVQAYLALAYMDSDLPQPALDAAQQAIAIDPGLALAYYARGRAEYALGQFDAADKDLSVSYKYVLTLEALFPKLFQATVLYQYGLGKVGIGQDSAALVQFNQAISLYPAYSLIYIARGNIYLRAKDYDHAHADFNKAITQFEASDSGNPALNEAYLGNGLAWLGLDRPDSALSNFQVVVNRDPQNFEANLGLGQSLLLTDSAKDSLDSFNAAFDLAKADEQKARVYYWRSRAYKALHRTDAEAADLAALAALNITSDLLPTAQARLTEIGPVPTTTAGLPGAKTSTPTAAAATPLGSASSSATPTLATTAPTVTSTSGTLVATLTPTPSKSPSPTATSTP